MRVSNDNVPQTTSATWKVLQSGSGRREMREVPASGAARCDTVPRREHTPREPDKGRMADGGSGPFSTTGWKLSSLVGN